MTEPGCWNTHLPKCLVWRMSSMGARISLAYTYSSSSSRVCSCRIAPMTARQCLTASTTLPVPASPCKSQSNDMLLKILTGSAPFLGSKTIAPKRSHLQITAMCSVLGPCWLFQRWANWDAATDCWAAVLMGSSTYVPIHALASERGEQDPSSSPSILHSTARTKTYGSEHRIFSPKHPINTAPLLTMRITPEGS